MPYRLVDRRLLFFKSLCTRLHGITSRKTVITQQPSVRVLQFSVTLTPKIVLLQQWYRISESQ
jgi:hypothetical protein